MRRLLPLLAVAALAATACSSGDETAGPSTTATAAPVTSAPVAGGACDDPGTSTDPAAAFEQSLVEQYGDDGATCDGAATTEGHQHAGDADSDHDHDHDHDDAPARDDAMTDVMSDGAMADDAGGGHHHGECADPVTDEQRSAADALIAAVEAEAHRFATPQQARDAGYVPVAPPFGGHGAHWVNPDLFDDGAILDPTRPESLMYLGDELESFMFLMDEVGDEPPMPGGCLTVWHSHDDLCMTGPIQEGGQVVWLTDFGPCPGGTEVIVPPDMLHVWLVEHPEGPFAGLET